MVGLRRALAIVLVLAGAGALAEEWSYTVRPGDDLWTLAARFCGSASFAPRIAAENGLADQSLIRPGMRLRVPVAWLVRQPVTAEVTAARGAAYLLVPAERPARVGDEIDMGQRLRTDAGSVVVRFADGSTLQVSDHSEVLFNVLTAFGDTGMVDTNLRFYRGRSTSRILPQNRGSRFRISTPTGTAAVRGTEFRVGFEGPSTLTETLEGAVGFLQDQEVSVPAGFGLVASPGAASREPLLAAPQWLSAPGAVALGTPLRWQPVSGARGYRVSVFAAADPLNPLREQLTAATELALDGLQTGPHAVAVRAISDSGLEGFDARLAVDVRVPAPALTAVAETVRGATRLRWQATRAPYTVQLSDAADFADARVLTAPAAELALPELPAGRYRWRVRDSESVFSAPGSLTVLPQPVTGLRGRTDLLSASLGWSPVTGADGYRVELFRGDGSGSPLQTLEVAEPAAELALPAYRRYRVRVSAVEHGLVGQAAAVELVPQPRAPWWLIPVALLGLLAL